MNVAVFCSSSNDLNPFFHQDAEKIGEFLGKGSHTLVYGGSKNGLMETVARKAHDAGAFIIGILPEEIKSQLSDFIDEKLFVDSLSERKELLQEYADKFVVLPGGFGTLDEMLEILASAQIGEHDKQLIIINSNGYYNSLIEMFNKIFDEKFSAIANKKLFTFVNNADECIELIKE